MGDVFNTGVGDPGGFGDVFNTGVGKKGVFNAYTLIGSMFAAPLLGGIINNVVAPAIGKVGEFIGGAYNAVAETPVGFQGNNIGTIGSIGKNLGDTAGAIVGGAQQVGEVAKVAAPIAAIAQPIINRPQPNPTPVTPTPPATPTPNPEPPPEVIEEPGAAPNLSDSRYANDPTAQFQEAVKKRRLAMLRKGMLDTIRTGPGGVAGSPALLVPAASGGGLKTKLGA
jgi:hypothetical protein